MEKFWKVKFWQIITDEAKNKENIGKSAGKLFHCA